MEKMFNPIERIKENGRTKLSDVSENIRETTENILNSLERTVNELLDRHPKRESDIRNIRQLLLLKGERDLRYWMKNRQDNGEKFLKEFSISAEFFQRKFFELMALLEEVPQDGSVLDIACGTGDIAILAAMRGQKTIGIELNPSQIRMGKFYAQKLGIEVDLRVGNLLEGDLPAADHWVAKHPCAKGIALPDEILKRWESVDSAHTLTCMTCCQGKAQDSFPGYSGIDANEWKHLCRVSDWTNNSDEMKRSDGQVAMDKIDAFRVGFLREQGLSAEVKKVEGTIKGNMICCSRR